MKYFVCALENVSVGIPAEKTERIIPNTRVQNVVCETETEAGTQTAYISLPLLFRQKDTAAPHGIILKTSGSGAELKTVLLTPRVDLETEIPEENIHSLSESLAGLIKFFRGAHFFGENVILVLDTKKLTENIV